MKTEIVLPADVFDTYELSCEAYGGIGAHTFVDKQGRPLCLVGHATAATIEDDDGEDDDGAYTAMLAHFGFADNAWNANDAAVDAILGCDRAWRLERVSWADYCAHRGIVRGA